MNVWPFNAETAEGFLAAQIVFSVLAVIAAAALQRFIAELVDPKQPSAQAGPSSGGVMPTMSSTIGEGSVPRGDDVFLIAAARGVDRLASALLSGALADGWLIHAPGDATHTRFTVLRDAKPALKSLVPLHQELARFPGPVTASTVQYSAKRVAIEKLMPKMLPELERLALRRSFANRVLISLAPIAVAIALLELARGRWAYTQDGSDGVGFIMFLGVLACALLAMNPDRRTTTSLRYFSWLWEASAAMRVDVAERRRTAPDEVALATAIEGATGSAGYLKNQHPFSPARSGWPLDFKPTPSPPLDLAA